MKISCEVVRDLLPLYVDQVCSEQSRAMVAEHLRQCPACQKNLEQLQNTDYEDDLRAETQDILNQHNRRVKRKAFAAGACIAVILLIPMLVCLIVNLATGHSLDWFFIVLTSLLVAASVTVVPLMAEQKRGLLTLGSFTVSLLLLFLTCCIYTGGKWFFVVSTSVLFGLSVLFAPYVFGQLARFSLFRNRKGLFSMFADTILLFVMLLTIGLYVQSGAYWRPAMYNAIICTGFAWLLFLTIRYTKFHNLIKAGLSIIECGAFLACYTDIENWILFDRVPGLSSANLFFWSSSHLNGNILLSILLSSVALGLILILIGSYLQKRK